VPLYDEFQYLIFDPSIHLGIGGESYAILRLFFVNFNLFFSAEPITIVPARYTIKYD
jgi:hypothetical protein